MRGLPERVAGTYVRGQAHRTPVAGEKGRQWWSVALGLIIVGIVSVLLWSWVDGIPSTSILGNEIGPFWIVALSAVAILLLLLITRLLRPRWRRKSTSSSA